MKTISLDADGLEATHLLGRSLGRAIAPGHVVALIGPLGAGKTTFVKGIADGAGVADGRQVNSPTFVIVNEYDADRDTTGPLRIYHIDAYRLRGPDDLDALGFDEMCEIGPVLIEWADRIAALLPADRLTIEIEPTGDHSRRFLCSADGPVSQVVLDTLVRHRTKS